MGGGVRVGCKGESGVGGGVVQELREWGKRGREGESGVRELGERVSRVWESGVRKGESGL